MLPWASGRERPVERVPEAVLKGSVRDAAIRGSNGRSSHRLRSVGIIGGRAGGPPSLGAGAALPLSGSSGKPPSKVRRRWGCWSAVGCMAGLPHVRRRAGGRCGVCCCSYRCSWLQWRRPRGCRIMDRPGGQRRGALGASGGQWRAQSAPGTRRQAAVEHGGQPAGPSCRQAAESARRRRQSRAWQRVDTSGFQRWPTPQAGTAVQTACSSHGESAAAAGGHSARQAQQPPQPPPAGCIRRGNWPPPPQAQCRFVNSSARCALATAPLRWSLRRRWRRTRAGPTRW